MWGRLKSPRPKRAAGGYLAHADKEIFEECSDDAMDSNVSSKMTARYRFRDLLLGDFAFNDDGER